MDFSKSVSIRKKTIYAPLCFTTSVNYSGIMIIFSLTSKFFKWRYNLDTAIKQYPIAVSQLILRNIFNAFQIYMTHVNVEVLLLTILYAFPEYLFIAILPINLFNERCVWEEGITIQKLLTPIVHGLITLYV